MLTIIDWNKNSSNLTKKRQVRALECSTCLFHDMAWLLLNNVLEDHGRHWFACPETTCNLAVKGW